MKYYELDKEEKELVDTLDESGFESVRDVEKETERLRSFARASLNRGKNINVRLSERTLQKLKAKAAEKGIPYQTLVASLLHQYTK